MSREREDSRGGGRVDGKGIQQRTNVQTSNCVRVEMVDFVQHSVDAFRRRELADALISGDP